MNQFLQNTFLRSPMAGAMPVECEVAANFQKGFVGMLRLAQVVLR